MRAARVFPWLLLLALALAQSLSLDLRPYLVQVVDGKEVYQENPTQVKPKDVLEWRLEAENRTEAPLRQVVLVIPIPKETYYLEGTAKPLVLKGATIHPEFSYDGGKTYGKPPLKKRVRVVENGREVEREVEVKPEEYTHVRWVIPELPAKAKVQVLLRTVVR
ncbi:hypothetical protein [Thermus filiformis]|uniref:DUF11 domain-containing protein n=1 Tax=Thermus filiformis TaxID=276 RepID=A0A0A2WXE9_THEFI|nr:hypothetical protein [Thermus filiformis]KGQ22975.1 hypothetical protein THFILI_01790 [Thermus filiformis]